MSDHDLRSITNGPGFFHNTFAARCWCGWESRDAQTEEIAKALHSEHREWLAGGPTVADHANQQFPEGDPS